MECKSRGIYLIGLNTDGNYELEDTVDFTVYIPKTDEYFTASLAGTLIFASTIYVSQRPLMRCSAFI